MSLFAKQTEGYSKEHIEKSKEWYKKFAVNHPAYHFVVNYAVLLQKNLTAGRYGNTPEAIFAERFARILTMESSRDINEDLRLVELEKDLVGLVENTDNNIFYRPLFFPSIFMNNDFHFEDLIVKGIYITECYTEEGTNSYFLHHPNVNDYAIFAVAADINQGCEFYLSLALVNKTIGNRFLDSKDEEKKMKKLSEYIRILICNIIDMVEGNDEDLNVVTIVESKEQNKKRIFRRKIPIPTRVVIRAKGEFKKYVNNFYNEGRKFSHKFPVRGHWRHFRDDKFVNVQGTKKWIKPSWKGEGITISKDYKVVNRE